MFVNSTLISKSSPSPQSAKLQKVLGEDSFSPTDKNEKIVEDEKVTFHEARWDELDENLWRRVFQVLIVKVEQTVLALKLNPFIPVLYR